MAKRKVKSKGLGDTVEKITTATGIKKVVEFFNGEPCEACERRKEYLNKVFRYRKINELTEAEYNVLKGIIRPNVTKLNDIEQRQLIEVYNRVFNAKKKFSTCAPCVRSLYQELEKILKAYEQAK